MRATIAILAILLSVSAIIVSTEMWKSPLEMLFLLACLAGAIYGVYLVTRSAG